MLRPDAQLRNVFQFGIDLRLIRRVPFATQLTVVVPAPNKHLTRCGQRGRMCPTGQHLNETFVTEDLIRDKRVGDGGEAELAILVVAPTDDSPVGFEDDGVVLSTSYAFDVLELGELRYAHVVVIAEIVTEAELALDACSSD